MNRAKLKIFLVALLALATLSTAAWAAPRPLGDAERALVEAFSRYWTIEPGGYIVDLMFSDTIDDGEFVFSVEQIAELGYTPHTKIEGASRVSYSWYRGLGDFGKGVGIASPDGAWIAEASAGTETASIILLRDGESVGRIDLPPSAVDEIKVQELFDQLEATRAGYLDTAGGVTFLVAPEEGQEPSDEWKRLGEPERIFPSAGGEGGRRIRFISGKTAVVELQAGGWKNGLFHKKGTIFAGTVSAGRVYEFTAPIVQDADESSYFLLFTSNDEDQSTVEWYLQEEGYTGRGHRPVWRLDYAAG